MEKEKNKTLEEIKERKVELEEALKGKLFTGTGDEQTPATDDEIDGFASFIIGLDLLSSVEKKKRRKV